MSEPKIPEGATVLDVIEFAGGHIVCTKEDGVFYIVGDLVEKIEPWATKQHRYKRAPHLRLVKSDSTSQA